MSAAAAADIGVFDTTNTRESKKNIHRVCLVICAAGPGSTKGMRADDGAGTLIVDIKHFNRILQLLMSNFDGHPMAGENRTCQSIVRGAVSEITYVLKAS